MCRCTEGGIRQIALLGKGLAVQIGATGAAALETKAVLDEKESDRNAPNHVWPSRRAKEKNCPLRLARRNQSKKLIAHEVALGFVLLGALLVKDVRMPSA